MTLRLKVIIATLLVSIVIGVTAFATASPSAETSSPPRATVASGGNSKDFAVQAQPSVPVEIGEIVVSQTVRYIKTIEMGEAVAYVATVERQNVANYVAAVQQAEWIEAQNAVGRYLGSRRAPAPAAPHYSAPSPSTSSGGGGATGACGGATNGADSFIPRESGGDPNVYNSGGSGAWGCYQIMPGTWSGAGCDQFGAYGSASASAQAQCASLLPLSAWASSGPT